MTSSPKTLSIDIETYSSLDLSKCGVYKYVEASDFEVLLFSFSLDEGDVVVVDLANGEHLPPAILAALIDDNVIKYAFNANFERVCLSRFLGMPCGTYLNPQSWRCTMVWSAYLGLPLSLKGVGAVLNLDKQKMDEGKELIRHFAKPSVNRSGEKWELFKSYNKRDVEVEMLIQKRLSKFPVPDFLWEEYCLDQIINDRGVLLDLRLVDSAIELDERVRNELMVTLQTLTNLENPNSVKQLSTWLKDNGVKTQSLGKKDVQKLRDESVGRISEVLSLRLQLSKSSIKKYQAMKNVVCLDGRARGMFQFYGANRTGRWAGRLIQVQNLYQNHLDDLEVARNLVIEKNELALDLLFDNIPDTLSQLIRTSFIPRSGYKFIVSDFSAIEARVIAWYAGETWRLEAFRKGEDIYCASASKMFGVPVVKHGVNGHLRQKGKQAELACIAEGQLVLTNKGLIPIEKVTIQHQLWDGERFVKHDGVIYKGVKEVITYEGLTATKDHLVWSEGKSEPVQFEAAIKSKSHLLQTGNGRSTIRMGENHQSRKKVVSKMESLQSSYAMSRLWKDKVDGTKQFTKKNIKRLSKLFTTKNDTKVVGSKINSRKTKMRKPKGEKLCSIWWKGDKIQLFLNQECRTMDFEKCRKCTQGFGDGQNRQQWKLRGGQYPLCSKNCKSSKQKDISYSKFPTKRMALYKRCYYSDVFKGNEKRRNNQASRDGSCIKKKELEINPSKARVYDILNVGSNNRFTVSNVLVHNCGYGGSVGALKAMGAIEMGLSEDELEPLVKMWRLSNPSIVNFWWEVHQAALQAIREKVPIRIHGLKFQYLSGLLQITLPSGRVLSYVKPRIELNQYGTESITYEGIDATKKWSRLETYGPKLVENIVQATARDILAFAMMNLKDYEIVMHIHDEVVMELPLNATLEIVTNIMSQTPSWAKGLILNADAYETPFYRKE